MRTSLLALLALVVTVVRVDAAAPPTPRDPLPDGAIVRLGYARLVGGYPLALLVSPDSRYVVCGRCWCDLVKGGEVPPPVHIPEDYRITALFRDGGYAVESRNKSLLFDPGKKTPRARIEADDLKFDGVGHYGVHIEEVGKTFAVKLGDLRTPDQGRTWNTLATLDKKPTRLQMSDDGGQVAWLHDDNQRISVYHTATQKEVVIAPRKGEEFHSFALSPDGKRIATLAAGVDFFDTTTGKPERRAERPDFSLSDMMFTPDGKLVVLTSNTDGLVVVPVDAKQPAYRLAIHGGRRHSRHACFADSKRIAAACTDGIVRVHDLRTGKQVDGHSRYPSFEGVQLLDDHTAASWTRNGLVVRWDIRSGRILSEKTLPLPAGCDSFLRMAFSADGRHVVASVAATDTKDKQLCLLADLTTGKILSQHTTDGYSRYRAAFSPSGKAVAILGNYDGKTRGNFTLLEVPTARRLWAREQVHGAFTFTHDGRNVLHAYTYGVSLIEEASGKERWKRSLRFLARNLDNAARLVAIDAKGQRAVVVRELDVSVFDGLTGKPLLHLWLGEAGEGGRKAAVSGCARYLATMNGANTLSLFDLAAKVHSEPILSHYLTRSDVRDLALNADGSRLVTAHENGTCLVWDVKRLMQKDDAPTSQVPEWDRLALLDAEQAQPAIVSLIRGGDRAVTLLSQKLTPAVALDAKRLSAWIADLDNDDFARRRAAEEALTKAHDQAEEALRDVLKKPASLEQARRAERLLKRIENRENDAERLRQMRAVEILERIASPDAIALLKKLAAGAPAAALTREARASLERLER